MARFDVFRSDEAGYLLDCQADLLSHFKTRLVVPLMPTRGAVAASRLHPIFEVQGQKLIMVTHLASAVPVSELGEQVISLAEQQGPIMNALDMLMTGY